MDSAAPPGSPVSPTRDKMVTEVRDEGSTVGKSDLPTIPKLGLSWVSAAQDKKVLKKFNVEITNRDGLHSVVIPKEALANQTPLWEDFVVGKFLDISPHIAKVHMVLNRIWKYGEVAAKVEVYEVNATTMRFRVPNPKAREKILRKGMWSIAGVPMVVTKWTPRAEEEKQEEESIPMWVHLRRVPLHMFSWEGLGFITSAVGFPVKLHPETLACSNFEEAKVFAKVDVSKALPKVINFTKNGKEFEVDFQFPWLPARCKLCDKWGHMEEVCKMKEEEKVSGKGLSTDLEKVVEGDLVSTKQLENSKEEFAQISKVGIVEKSLEADTQKEENPAGEKVVVTSDETSSWALVSPAKMGRSPAKDQTEVLHISASKFAVLSVEEEREDRGNTT